MTKWEYLVLRPEADKEDDLAWVLSENGKEGWELVAVTGRYVEIPPLSNGGLNLYTMFFKRPKEG